MTALGVSGGRFGQGEDGILDYMLGRERRFWEGLATSHSLPPLIAQGMGRAMAAITLGGGANDKKLRLWMLSKVSVFLKTSQHCAGQTAWDSSGAYSESLDLSAYDGSVFIDCQGANSALTTKLAAAGIHPIAVIDHHEKQEQLPEAEFIDIRRTGATATIYTEYIPIRIAGTGS